MQIISCSDLVSLPLSIHKRYWLKQSAVSFWFHMLCFLMTHGIEEGVISVMFLLHLKCYKISIPPEFFQRVRPHAWANLFK